MCGRGTREFAYIWTSWQIWVCFKFAILNHSAPREVLQHCKHIMVMPLRDLSWLLNTANYLSRYIAFFFKKKSTILAFKTHFVKLEWKYYCIISLDVPQCQTIALPIFCNQQNLLVQLHLIKNAVSYIRNKVFFPFSAFTTLSNLVRECLMTMQTPCLELFGKGFKIKWPLS